VCVCVWLDVEHDVCMLHVYPLDNPHTSNDTHQLTIRTIVSGVCMHSICTPHTHTRRFRVYHSTCTTQLHYTYATSKKLSVLLHDEIFLLFN
jgi:hypothetical protein